MDSIEDISHNASLSPDHTSIISLEISGFILDGFIVYHPVKEKTNLSKKNAGLTPSSHFNTKQFYSFSNT